MKLKDGKNWKLFVIEDLMINRKKYKMSDPDMLELLRSIIVYRGTVEEFFKVNFNVNLSEKHKIEKE